MSTGLALLVLWLLAATVMLAGWIWQRRRENAGIVDVLWAALLAVGAVLLATVGKGASGPRVLLGILGGVWGLRLATHLWVRVRGNSEDGRYRELRARWHGGPWRWLAFFQFQALLVPMFALPFAAVAVNPRTRVLWLVVGTAVWLLAVCGETVADRQLTRFRANPAHRGLTCRAGLWRYSRHPNYFFEWLHWFAYPALAAGSPRWLLAWLGPLVMFVFLRFLSGVPWAEAQALRTRGEDYRDYQHRTPMFFPWFPRHFPDTRS